MNVAAGPLGRRSTRCADVSGADPATASTAAGPCPGRARAACSRPRPGRSPEVAPDAAAPGRAHQPQLAVAAGGVAGAATGWNDPADTGGDNDAGEIGGPPPAAPAGMARSGAARDERCAAQQ